MGRRNFRFVCKMLCRNCSNVLSPMAHRMGGAGVRAVNMDVAVWRPQAGELPSKGRACGFRDMQENPEIVRRALLLDIVGQTHFTKLAETHNIRPPA
jgi:hypothetical protein